MADKMAPFPGEFKIDVNINNGNVSATSKVNIPSHQFVDDKTFDRMTKEVQGLSRFLEEVKKVKDIDLDTANLDKVQGNIENFGGSKEERNAIIKDLKSISTLLRSSGDELAKTISGDLLESLERLKDISIQISQNSKNANLARNTQENTKRVDKVFGAVNDNANGRKVNKSRVDTSRPSLTRVHGEEFTTKYGDKIQAGERLSVGGTPLGTYDKQYNKYQRNYEEAYTRRKKLLDKAGVKSVKQLEEKLRDAPEDENLNNLYNEVISANDLMVKWAKASESVVNQIVKIFENSTEELQNEFLSKLNFHENINPNSDLVAKAAGVPLGQISQGTKKNIAKILEKVQKEKFDYTEGRHASPLREALYQKLKDYQYDFGLDANDEELSYGGSKQPWEMEEERIKEERKNKLKKQEQRKEEEYILQSSLDTLRSDDFKEILKDKDGAQIATNLIRQIFGELENASVNLNEQTLSENYNEFLARKEKEDFTQEQPTETIAFRFREGTKGILEELSADPRYAEQASIISSKLGMSGIERGKRATTVEEDERQAYQRISNLLTFADTVDKAWEGIAAKRGISVEEVKNDALKDEYFKSRYEESAEAIEIWNKMGGPSNPSETLKNLFGVSKEQSELYQQIPSKEIENIFAVLSRLTKSGSIKTYKDGELVESTSAGIQAVINKAIQRMAIGAESPDKIKAGDFYSGSEYRGLEIEEGKIHEYSPAERTALFHKAGNLTYEVGATNLAQARKNAEALLEEEIQKITSGLGEGETFQDNARTTRLKNLITEIDNLKKTEDELYGTRKTEDEFPLLPNEEQANKQIETSAKKSKKEISQEIKNETQSLAEDNKIIKEHQEGMEQAALAEKEKMLISSELSKKINEETKAITNENNALDEHINTLDDATKKAEDFENVKIEYEQGEFLGPTEEDPNRHTYRSKKTGKEVDFTATGVAGLAFSAASGQSKEDFKKVSDALQKAYASGADFSAESLGILDKNTGKVDNNQWNYIKRGQEATIKGTMLHKIAELATKFEVDTIDDLEKKLFEQGNESEKINYRDLLDETKGKIGILGSNFTKEDMQSFLTAYMDTMFPKKSDGTRDIQKPIYSESPMIAKISKGNKSYTVGMSPDEIFLNNWLMTTDIKTGKVNPEKNSFQLALNARTFQEGVKQGAFPGISSDVLKKDLELSILHYAEGVVTKIIYGLMPDEEIFNVVDTAAQGRSFSSDERKRFNYESSLGRATSTPQDVETTLMTGASKDDREIYKAMLNDIKKIQQAKKQIAILDVAIEKSSGDVQANLIKQREAQERIVEEAENAYNISKNQVELDRTKTQILENERQRDQRSGLSDAELEAAAEKERQKIQQKVVNNALKNYKTSNKAVLDQEVEVARAQSKLDNYSGSSELERRGLETNLRKQQEILYTLQQQQAVLNGNILTYRNEQGELQEIELTQEQVNQLKEVGNQLELEHDRKIAKVNASVKETKSLFDQLADGLKRSLTNLVDYSLAGLAIGKIRESFSEAIRLTYELDAALTDLQIAAGTTREETTSMLRDYNDLAKELGRTTQEVAVASNDWLRAGYLGEEAAQLTEASMQLSTLGMIDAASATTNLISVMKGWQLEAEEVGSVVDKLTAIDMEAATSAGDLATAMAEGNNAARLAGASLDWYAGILAATIDTTQMGATRVGNAFKTMFARYSNVKAGKFAATEQDMMSDSYNEDEFENLNDVAKVLGKIGISIQDGNEFRNIEEVLTEIAEKWETLDGVEKNAVATALAGTRQREALYTALENWTKVTDLATVSANSLGSAEKKMAAYSDSLEASQNRVTAAFEKWVIAAEGNQFLIDLNNLIAGLIENVDTLILSFSSLFLALNAKKVGGLLTEGLGFLGGKVLEKGAVKAAPKSQTSLTETLADKAMEILYMNGENTIGSLLEKQKKKQMVDDDLATRIMEGFSAINDQDISKKLLQNDTWNEWLRTGQLDPAARESFETALREMGMTANQAAKALDMMTSEVNEETRESIQDQQETLSEMEGMNITSLGIQGLASIISPVAGGVLGGYWGNELGGTAGAMVGTTLGGIAMNALSSAGPVGAAVSLGVSLVGGIVTGIKEHKEAIQKELEEAAVEAAATAEESYKSAITSNSLAERYDELVKGVDSLGRNVSLTDEEYEEFLDTSNQLAEIFPSLVQRTDSMGNSLIGMNGKVGEVTSSIEAMTEAMQKNYNTSLIDPNYVGPSLEEAQDIITEYSEKVKDSQYELNKITKDVEAYRKILSGNGLSEEDVQRTYDLYLTSGYDPKAYGHMGYAAINVGDKEYADAIRKELKNNDISTVMDVHKEFGSYLFVEKENTEKALEIINTYLSSNAELAEDFKNRIEEADATMEGLRSNIRMGNEEIEKAQETLEPIISAQVQRAIGESTWNAYDEEYQQMFMKIAMGVNPLGEDGKAKDAEEYLDEIKSQVDKMQVLLADPENALIVEMAFEVNDSRTAEEAEKARQAFLELLMQMIPEDYTIDEANKILVPWGFEYIPQEGEIGDSSFKDRKGEISDSENIRTQLINKGLSADVTSQLGAANLETLKFAYQELDEEILKSINSVDKFYDAVNSEKLSEDNLAYFVSEYERLSEMNIIPGSAEEKYMNRLVDRIKQYATAVGAAKDDWEDIWNKVQNMPDTTLIGTTTKSVEEVQEQYSDYRDFANYLASEDFDGRNIDAEIYGRMMQYEDLLTHLVSGNTEGLMNELTSYLDSAGEHAKGSFEEMVANSEELSQQAYEQNIDLVQGLIDNYNVDLRAFGSASVAKEVANNLLVGDIESAWNTMNSKLEELYAQDMITFSEYTAAKAANLQALIGQLGINVMSKEEWMASQGEGMIWGDEDSINSQYNTYLDLVYSSANRTKKNEIVEWGKELGQAISDVTTQVLNNTGFGMANVGGEDTTKGSDSKDEDEDEGPTMEEILDALKSTINKEYEAMKVFDEKTGKATGETQYFAKMEEVLKKQLENYKVMLEEAETEKDRYDIISKIESVEVELANLDDEKLEDELNLVKTQELSLGTQIDIQKQLIKSSDTIQEAAERQQALNDLLREEYELRKSINDFQVEEIQRFLDRVDPESSGYSDLLQMQIDEFNANINNSYNEIIKKAEELKEKYSSETETFEVTGRYWDSYKIGKTPEEAKIGDVSRTLGGDFLIVEEGTKGAQYDPRSGRWSVKIDENGKSSIPKYNQDEIRELIIGTEEIQSLYQDYIDNLDKKVESILAYADARIKKIDFQMGLLETSKPEEWSSIEQITSYASQNIELLEKKIPILEEALSNSANMTAEQIEEYTNQLNEVYKAIHEARIQQQQDIIEFQDQIYSAMTWQIQQYIDQINDQKEAIEDYYDEELDKLNKVNDAKERSIELEKLQDALLNARKEKERVYTEGIGFSYQANRTKIKDAERDLDDFYLDDKINDLNNTKEQELAELDERIENWNKYLEALQEAHDRYENSTKEHLLFELLNVQNQEQLYNKINSDMENYIALYNQNVDLYGMTNTKYIGIFTEFLNEYNIAVETLDQLQKEVIQIFQGMANSLGSIADNSLSGMLGESVLGGSGGSGGDLSGLGNGVSISGKYDWSDVGSSILESGETGRDWSQVWWDADNAYKNGLISKEEADAIKQEAHWNKEEENSGSGQTFNPDSGKWEKSYSDGGVVDFTGLAMLHGTPSRPEYVLNNDQAWQLLRNFSTTKTPERTNNLSSGNQEIFSINGDIILNDVKDPSQFWKKLMDATRDRFNVTKRNR